MKQLRWITWLAVAFTALAVFLAIILVTSSKSAAQDGEWLPRRWKRATPAYHHYNYPRERHLYLRTSRREPERYDFRAKEETRCLGVLFSDKGRELSSEESALKDAERSWASLIREERGEKFMDLRYAQRYSSRCQRSSTGESATAKTLETITGGAAGILYRCRIFAEPCTAPKTQEERGEK